MRIHKFINPFLFKALGYSNQSITFYFLFPLPSLIAFLFLMQHHKRIPSHFNTFPIDAFLCRDDFSLHSKGCVIKKSTLQLDYKR